MRRILVTSALPYANGPIHLGHLVEYLQTDIWVRFQKLRGNRCIYVCADDTHGTAIMIRARQEGIGEEELIARMQKAHQADFAGFQIEFDNYGSTNSAENRAVLRGDLGRPAQGRPGQPAGSHPALRPRGRHLPGRPLRQGTCPNCKSPDQYGDSCDKCGEHYSPTDLIDPVSTLSGAKPEMRTASHLFVNIEQLHGFLDAVGRRERARCRPKWPTT